MDPGVSGSVPEGIGRYQKVLEVRGRFRNVAEHSGGTPAQPPPPCLGGKASKVGAGPSPSRTRIPTRKVPLLL